MSEHQEPKESQTTTENNAAAEGNGSTEINLVEGKIASLEEFRKKKDHVKVLHNFTVIGQGKKSENVGINAVEVQEQLTKLMGPWPKRVGKRLFARSTADKLTWLESPSALIGWLSRHKILVSWSERAPGAITKSEFFAALQTSCDEYVGIASMPHFPPMPGFYYDHPNIDDEASDDGSFDKLLAFFKPASEIDGDLLRAAFMTLFWGGPGGTRPAFVISSKDETSGAGGGRGVGKTVLTDIMGHLCGGIIDLSHRTKDFEAIRKRILSCGTERIVRLDNVKDALSHADIESMITTSTISGHQMYVGNAAVPNMFTYIMTLNDPEMSKDMAQRAVVIKLERPEYGDNWHKNVLCHIKEKKWQIIAGIKCALESEPAALKAGVRFSYWAEDVLARATKNASIVDTIKENQNSVDNDEDRSADVSSVIAYQLSKYIVKDCGTKATAPTDQTKMTFMLRRSLVHHWLMRDLNLRGKSQRALAKMVRGLNIPQLEVLDSPRDGYFYYLWKPSGGGEAEVAWVIFEDAAVCKMITENLRIPGRQEPSRTEIGEVTHWESAPSGGQVSE